MDALTDLIVYVLYSKESLVVSLCSSFSFIPEDVCFDFYFPVFDNGSFVSLATQRVASALAQAE